MPQKRLALRQLFMHHAAEKAASGGPGNLRRSFESTKYEMRYQDTRAVKTVAMPTAASEP